MVGDEVEFYIVDSKALPDIVVRTVEAKRLIESKKVRSVREAVEIVGISRSAFYKYKDMAFPFYENSRGKTVTYAMDLEDRHGILSEVLGAVAGFGANVLTLNTTIPINKISNATITIETGSGDLHDLSAMFGKIEGVLRLKIIARE